MASTSTWARAKEIANGRGWFRQYIALRLSRGHLQANFLWSRFSLLAAVSKHGFTCEKIEGGLLHSHSGVCTTIDGWCKAEFLPRHMSQRWKYIGYNIRQRGRHRRLGAFTVAVLYQNSTDQTWCNPLHGGNDCPSKANGIIKIRYMSLPFGSCNVRCFCLVIFCHISLESHVLLD